MLLNGKYRHKFTRTMAEFMRKLSTTRKVDGLKGQDIFIFNTFDITRKRYLSDST